MSDLQDNNDIEREEEITPQNNQEQTNAPEQKKEDKTEK